MCCFVRDAEWVERISRVDQGGPQIILKLSLRKFSTTILPSIVICHCDWCGFCGVDYRKFLSLMCIVLTNNPNIPHLLHKSFWKTSLKCVQFSKLFSFPTCRVQDNRKQSKNFNSAEMKIEIRLSNVKINFLENTIKKSHKIGFLKYLLYVIKVSLAYKIETIWWIGIQSFMKRYGVWVILIQEID